MPVTVNEFTVEKSGNFAQDRTIFVTCDIDIDDGTARIRYTDNAYVLPDEANTVAKAKAWLRDHFKRMVAAERELAATRAAEKAARENKSSMSATLSASDLEE